MGDTLSEPESLVAIALAAMYADDLIRAEEDEEILDRLLAFPLFSSWSEQALRDLFAHIERRYREMGERALIVAARDRLRPELRATAFVMAVEVVMSDHDLAESEVSYLDELASILEIEKPVAAKILDVQVIRNRREL